MIWHMGWLHKEVEPEQGFGKIKVCGMNNGLEELKRRDSRSKNEIQVRMAPWSIGHSTQSAQDCLVDDSDGRPERQQKQWRLEGKSKWQNYSLGEKLYRKYKT